MLNLTSAITVIRLRGASIKGRASRAEFWWATLIMSFLGAWLYILEYQVIPGTVLEKVYLYTCIGMGVICYAYQIIIGIRRLHDLNLSGYIAFINVIPGLGYLIFLGLMLKQGQCNFNRFGPSPLYDTFYKALCLGKENVLDVTTEDELKALDAEIEKEIAAEEAKNKAKAQNKAK